MPPPDYETVRYEHLGVIAAAPDLVTVKDFLCFYSATSRPRLDAKLPTVDSINIVAEWFFAGFARVTGTATDEEERSKVHNVSVDRLPPLGTAFLMARANCLLSGFVGP